MDELIGMVGDHTGERGDMRPDVHRDPVDDQDGEQRAADRLANHDFCASAFNELPDQHDWNQQHADHQQGDTTQYRPGCIGPRLHQLHLLRGGRRFGIRQAADYD